jgi:methionyl-tRNA formyltransferase
LIQGLSETGVSIMQIEEGLDTGPVRLTVATPIFPDETGGELAVRLSELGALALVEAMELLGTGNLDAEVQDHTQATHAPKISRELARISWDASADEISRLVRALDPKPGAWTTLEEREVKLFGPRLREGGGGKPGTVLETEPALAIVTGSGTLEFADVQPGGSNRMQVTEWVRGRGASVGQRFV